MRHNGIDCLAGSTIGLCLQRAQCPIETLKFGSNLVTVNGNGFGEMAKALLTNWPRSTFRETGSLATRSITWRSRCRSMLA